MTIASEITRLQGAKADIATSIGNKGVTVPSSTKLDGYNLLIDQIKTVDETPLGIMGATEFGGMYEVGRNQYISGLEGCVSYDTGSVVLIGYMGKRQTYDGYDQKDCHFVRRKSGKSRKESYTSIGTGTTYSFYNRGLYLTKESDDSYLFTANAWYNTDNTPWKYCAKIRYTVSTDTFTLVSSGSGESYPENDDMNLFTASYETTSYSRAALFTLRNT